MASHIGNDTKLIFDAYDLALGGREVTWATIRPVVDYTDFSHSETRRFPTVPGMEVTYSGLFRTGARANEEGLRSLIESSNVKIVSLFFGSTENDKAWFSRVTVGSMLTAPRLGEVLPLSGTFIHDRATEFGRIAMPKTSITSSSHASQSADGIRDGASSGNTGGAVWGYHAMGDSSQTINVALQHASSDDADAYADYDADSSVAARGGARNEVSGTLKRYTRVLVQGGSSQAVAAFLRRL